MNAAISNMSKKIIALLIVILITTGCVNRATLPAYARSGDIVNFGMAGIKLNTDGFASLRPSDVTATITDANSTVHNVKVINTYRAFPDNTSFYAYGALNRDTSANPAYGNVEPFDGQWWVALHLVDPATDIPLPLAVGDAVLSLSSAAVTDTFGSDGDLSAITIEIVSGVEEKQPTHPDFYLYSAFQEKRALTIQPDSLAGVSKIGGLQLKLDYDPNIFPAGSTQIPHLVPISHDPHINIIQNTIDNGDGTHALVVMITNPLGFVPDSLLGGSWVVGASTFKDLNFAVLSEDTNLTNYAANYSIDTTNSFFIDENGDKILSVNPLLGLNY